MEFINVQSITLLTAVFAVVSNFLSMNENIAKFGLVNVIKTVCYYVMPILFIKQILLTTYNYKIFLSILVSISPILLFVIIKMRKIKFFSSDDTVVFYAILFAAIFIILNISVFDGYGITGYHKIIAEYINGLNDNLNFKEMLYYITNNLECTLYVLSDTITIILFMVVDFKELSYYKNDILSGFNFLDSLNENTNINFRTFVKNVIVLMVFASGMLKNIIHYICQTIIF